MPAGHGQTQARGSTPVDAEIAGPGAHLQQAHAQQRPGDERARRAQGAGLVAARTGVLRLRRHDLTLQETTATHQGNAQPLIAMATQGLDPPEVKWTEERRLRVAHRLQAGRHGGSDDAAPDQPARSLRR